MGNCSFKGTTTGECHHSIRILTDTGSILQFKGPKTVAQVLEKYHGYGVFRQGHVSLPLQEQESLSYGFLYYLLPLKDGRKAESDERVVHVAACDYVENLSNGSALEVLPYSVKNGVWKVKLVIDTRHLEEILSEQVNTGALIEKMRMAATAYSTSSPTRSRTMSAWKVGWKPTLFSAFLTPVKSGKIAKSDAIVVAADADGSILDLDSC
ncbi:uncharacterized protein LOC127104293 [Lathyrus oleraceus]|uniref:uncharacterized protein LOC127104293 n=1 Tax=Pisum sativum TaxID=3888 RepID=UPI0021CF2C4C|nr:uncharacterized protein LOC127104293 [Pisum sativum]